MNLAADMMAADVRLEDIKTRIEALLTAAHPGWQSWEFLRPDGISVYGSFDSARGAAVLHARGFVTVILHDHLANEKLITCICKPREAAR